MANEPRANDPHAAFRRNSLLRLAGLIGEEVLSEHEKHRSDCAFCRDEWNELIREREAHSSDEQVPHIPPRMLVNWKEVGASVGVIEREALARHLDHCDQCCRELRFLGFEPKVEAPQEAERAIDLPELADDVQRWRARIGELARQVASLLVPTPLPVAVHRGVPRNEVDEQRMLGLAAYTNGEYETAAERLGDVVKARPEDAETALYFGSAVCLSGLPREASEIFRQVFESTDSEELEEESLWQLAQATAGLGDIDEARTVLHSVTVYDGENASRAREMLKRLETLPPA